MKRPERAYHWRGLIERGGTNSRCVWRDGYSPTGPNGGVIHPWFTRRQCKSEALRDGVKAVFYRDNKKED